MATTIRYAGYPTAPVFDRAAKGADVVKQLLWGDWVRVEGVAQNGFVSVRVRGVSGFMSEGSLQANRLLELVFVDIGQGDGCLVITPDDKVLVVDAGAGDNMARFLAWRFAGFKTRIEFEAAILSHSDLDHYGGFADLFAQPNLFFRHVYTNGLMERAGGATDVLGPRTKKGAHRYVTSLVRDRAELDAFLADPAASKGKKYPTMLRAARDANRFGDFRMLSVKDGHVPGFGPGENDVTMELLGPVPEAVAGKPALRWLGDAGKTKNGHSVVVRMRYGKVAIFAGGDLNIPSESLLLAHHSGSGAVPNDEAARLALAVQARARLGADFAKACHHGSADVSPAFLTAIAPLATIVSSGDEEAYSHPRADTLGLIGKHSRGARPTIFSTELARSAPERIKHPSILRAELAAVGAVLGQTLTPAEKKKKLEARIAKLDAALDRSIATYGAINLRTDGESAIVAQKIEAPRDPATAWDVYRYERNAADELELVSEHD